MSMYYKIGNKGSKEICRETYVCVPKKKQFGLLNENKENERETMVMKKINPRFGALQVQTKDTRMTRMTDVTVAAED